MFSVIVGILVPLFWSLYRAKADLEPDSEGWFILRPSLFDHVIGFSQILFALLWISLSIAAFFFGTNPLAPKAVFLFGLMFSMGCWFLLEFFRSYSAKLRFNETKIEYRNLWREISANWNEVVEVKARGGGPRVITPEGNIPLSNTRRGYYQLIETALKNGVRVEDSPYLKTPEESVRRQETILLTFIAIICGLKSEAAAVRSALGD